MQRIGFGWRLVVAAALLVFGSAHGALADVVSMASFSVTGPTGSNFFTDPFNLNGTLSGNGAYSGVSTNTTPSNPVNYNITGSFSESGGKATLNTGNGALYPSSLLSSSPIQQVTASYAGSFLRSNPLGTTGIFDLSSPSLGAAYGIEMIDLNLTHNGDIVGLRVFGSGAGAAINLVNVDIFNGTLSVIDSIAVDLTHDQIMLDLSLSGGTVSGSYAYGDNGVFGASTTFANTTNLANDNALYIRPAFNAFAPVPEPGTLVMFASGLVGLVYLRWRQKAKRAATRSV